VSNYPALGEVFERIEHLEKHVPVGQMRLFGHQIWPMVRHLLVQKYFGIPLEKVGDRFDATTRTGVAPWWQGHPLPHKDRALLEQLGEQRGKAVGRGDLLLLWQSSKEAEWGGERHFHRFMDPIRRLAGDGVSCVQLGLNDGNRIMRPELAWVDADLQAVEAVAWRWVRLHAHPPASLSRALARLGPDAPSAENVFTETASTLCWKWYFAALLRECRVRVLAMVCFYQRLGFALSAAARVQGIASVEVQHGQQGDKHYMYGSWRNLPRGGYEWLPTHFWTWGIASAERLRKWANAHSKIEVLLGGNPWLTWQIANRSVETNSRGWNRPVETILVSMQNVELPDFFWEAVRRCPGRRWWFRLHPRFPELRDSIEKRLRSADGNEVNWEIDHATAADFYDLLAEIDLQITGWSTTAYEALHFQVPTLLIHPNGRETMREYVERGVFQYAESSDAVVEQICSPHFAAPPRTGYMVADVQVLRQTVQRLVNR